MTQKLYIHNNVKNHELTNKIISNLNKKYEIEYYDKYWDVSNQIFLNIWNNFNINFENYKTNLNNRNKYLFLKKWNNLIVEDDRNFSSFLIYKNLWYTVYNIKIWQNCNLGCDYCYLLSSNKFNPELTIYSNIEEEINKFIKNNKNKKIVFNLWEYTDTFLFDWITKLTSFFYNICKENPNIIVETRTKLNNFKINFPPIQNFILGFSISINDMDKFWNEKLILNKLKNIKVLTNKWYKVALKFDPITTLKWYNENFFSLINNMNKENIHHFSVWTIRFTTNLWKIISKCSNTNKTVWDFKKINWKYVNIYRKWIYEFFIKNMKTIWINDYYLSMEPI